MVAFIVAVALSFFTLSQSESSSCQDNQCQTDGDQFAMLQASKVHRQDTADQLQSSGGRPTCATSGRDVYEPNTYAAPSPVKCCDGQAAPANAQGKFLCPPKLCANAGWDVYDDYTFRGHTPVACCDGQNPKNEHGKMVCPAKPCAHAGQDVYDDYTFKGHTPVKCCDGKSAANSNGKMLCPGGYIHAPSPPPAMTQARDGQIWCDKDKSPRPIEGGRGRQMCTRYTCDEKVYINCCRALNSKAKECWGHGCLYHCA